MRSVSQLTNFVENKLNEYAKESNRTANIGIVLPLGDGTARIYDLENVVSGELLEFEDQTLGVALNLETNNVGAILMDKGQNVQQESSVKATGKIAQIPVGKELLGREGNPIVQPLDEKSIINLRES